MVKNLEKVFPLNEEPIPVKIIHSEKSPVVTDETVMKVVRELRMTKTSRLMKWKYKDIETFTITKKMRKNIT